MSETTTLVELQKKRNDLENHWSNLLQKEKNLNNDVKTLEEKIQAQLEGRIKATDSSIGTLESTKGDLERRLKELEERSETQAMPNEPVIETVPINEEPQVMLAPEAPKAVANEGEVWHSEETKERHKEEKKRKWV